MAVSNTEKSFRGRLGFVVRAVSLPECGSAFRRLQEFDLGGLTLGGGSENLEAGVSSTVAVLPFLQESHRQFAETLKSSSSSATFQKNPQSMHPSSFMA